MRNKRIIIFPEKIKKKLNQKKMLKYYFLISRIFGLDFAENSRFLLICAENGTLCREIKISNFELDEILGESRSLGQFGKMKRSAWGGKDPICRLNCD